MKTWHQSIRGRNCLPFVNTCVHPCFWWGSCIVVHLFTFPCVVFFCQIVHSWLPLWFSPTFIWPWLWGQCQVTYPRRTCPHKFNKISRPEKSTDLLQFTDKHYHIILYRVHLAWAGFELATLVYGNGETDIIIKRWHYYCLCMSEKKNKCLTLRDFCYRWDKNLDKFDNMHAKPD
jgi:hypothetical protein